MNRKTKGAIAVGAGAILLLGGMGSYALWSDQEDVAGGSITTGDFGLDCPAGTWTDVSGDVPVVTINPASDLMVPGDTWEYNANCTVTATGKNMRAELSVIGIGTGSTTPTTTYVTTTTVVGGGAPNAPVTVSNGEVLPVTVTVAFSSATPNTEFTNGTINVSGMKIELNQVRP
ncbi:alternate-type signal peptide domain-containing protein [Gordonia aurantiaca]|uniref:alternate-type signal peptide domain-containing protein n=1 Tax=Gordonia sp. B21 TaxID=3151852 RepID=UPI00326504B3